MAGGRNGWLVAACVVALVHALPSFYWAAGGSWLVWTVGSWAEDLQHGRPLFTAFALALVGLAKLAGGLVPLLNSAGRLAAPRFWWWACLTGAVVLIIWGGANTVLGGASLLGAFGAVSDADRHALAGHVLLWDPLFLIWGLLLVAGLRAQRSMGRAGS